MQTTLLGLAIAIILALLAALVGPLLIDLGNYRSLLEAEAHRLTGVNIRVTGAIDARLLPSPRLTLHDITVGDGDDAIRARYLDVEFALGPLMRGEWRATEMRLAGPQVSLGLDVLGRVRAPSLAVSLRPDYLSINRLRIEDGTITLTNAGNDGSITFGRVSFNGEVRSLVGPMKGEGSATVSGKLYPYRVTTNRLSDDGSMRVRVSVDSADYPLSIEAEGAIAVVAREPSFDGTLNLLRPVGIAARNPAEPADALTQPWRIGGKIKATGKSALMENVEFQYGSEEQGFKLTGVADLKFGRNPRFQGVLSGRQIDVDRVVSGSGGAGQSPVVIMRKFAELGTAAFRTTMPMQLGLGIDLVTLGGNSIQNLRGDISSSADGWSLDRFEFRAPGMTQVRVSGRLAIGANGGSDDALGASLRVDIGRVNEVDAMIGSVIDNALRLAAVGRPAKHHGAKAELRDLDPASTQHAIAHLYHQPCSLRPAAPARPARRIMAAWRRPKPHPTLACVSDAILRGALAGRQKASPSCSCASDAPLKRGVR